MITRNTAEAIIVNKKGELLLQKKTMDYSFAPGKWIVFGGGIEEGESAEEALKRELKEESGMDFNKFKLFKFKEHKFNLPTETILMKRHIFGVLFEGNISDISLDEGAGFAFFDKSEIDKADISELIKDDLKDFLKVPNFFEER